MFIITIPEKLVWLPPLISPPNPHRPQEVLCSNQLWILFIWNSSKRKSSHHKTKTKPPLPGAVFVWLFRRSWSGARVWLWPRSGAGTLGTRSWTASWMRWAASWSRRRWRWRWTTAAASFFLVGRGAWLGSWAAERRNPKKQQLSLIKCGVQTKNYWPRSFSCSHIDVSLSPHMNKQKSPGVIFTSKLNQLGQ